MFNKYIIPITVIFISIIVCYEIFDMFIAN